MRTPEELNVAVTELRIEIGNNLKAVVETLIKRDDIEDNHLLLPEYDISQPIQNNADDDNLTETISGIVISEDKMYFTIDTYNGGYDCSIEDITTENLLYLYDEIYTVIN
jgi:hypothetical protein